jgi:hypothetical protein
MSHNSLIAEYNRRTGGSITPPKKVINCSASETKFKLGDSVNEVPIVKRGQLAAERSHISSSKIVFGEVLPTSETQGKAAKPQPPAKSVEDHIEFGKSETTIFRVKKIQAPKNLGHVAGTKVAFGDRNIPTDADSSKPAKKHAPETDASKAHINMGEFAIAPLPPSAFKCGLQITFEETESNMAPSITPMKPAKVMAETLSKESMAETLSFPEENRIVQKINAHRMPVGGNTSFVFGDQHTPAKQSVHNRVFSELSVKSPRPVQVNNTSRSMKSSCFDQTSPVPKDKRAKKEVDPDHPCENSCPKNVDMLHDIKKVDNSKSPLKSAKKATIHSDKTSLNSIFSNNTTYEPAVRSSKKGGIAPSSVFSFAGMSDMNAPPPKLVPTTIAAGAKPKSLEPTVRTRGPVGGRVSVIFG